MSGIYDFTAKSLAGEDVRGERLKVIRSIARVPPERVGEVCVRGQYLGGEIDGKPVEDMDAFRRQIDRLSADKPGATLLFVLRQTETLFVRLRTPWGRRQ